MSSQQVQVINPILTNVARGYIQSNFVARALFPRVGVSQTAGKIIEFGKESFRLYNTRRAPGSETKRIVFGYEGRDYALTNHAVDAQIPREHLRDANEVPGIDLAQRAVQLVMRVPTTELEYQAAKLATDASAYPESNKETLSSSDQWSHADSKPSEQIAEAREAVRTKIGVRPNVVVVSAEAFSALEHHPAIIDRLKYTGRDSVTADMLAQLWNVQSVVIAEAVVVEGQNDEFSDIWGNHVVVAYAPQNPLGREEPSYAYLYEMEGHPFVEQPYWDAPTKSWIYGTAYERSPEIVGIEAGYLFSAVKGS